MRDVASLQSPWLMSGASTRPSARPSTETAAPPAFGADGYAGSTISQARAPQTARSSPLKSMGRGVALALTLGIAGTVMSGCAAVVPMVAVGALEQAGKPSAPPAAAQPAPAASQAKANTARPAAAKHAPVQQKDAPLENIGRGAHKVVSGVGGFFTDIGHQFRDGWKSTDQK